LAGLPKVALWAIYVICIIYAKNSQNSVSGPIRAPKHRLEMGFWLICNLMGSRGKL